MKILLFTLEYPPFYGGVANYYGNLVKHWPETNSVTVLHNNDGLLISKSWPFLKWLPAVWRLWKTTKRQKFEHILVGHILPLGTASWIVTRFTQTPYSVILHGMDFTYAVKKRRKRILARKILSGAKYIICSNSYTKGLVTKEFDRGAEKNISVVNPGVDECVASNVYRAAELKKQYELNNAFVLLTLGRLVKRKGVDMVIKAMAEIVKQVKNVKYVTVGTGPDEKYLHQLREKLPDEVKKNIIFLGKISEEDKWTWLETCEIFIMPSRNENGDFEGFGIVYLEAALARKPAIAGRSGGIEDAVVDNETGLLVDPKAPRAITDAVIKLYHDSNLRQRLGNQGRERVLRDFMWEKQIARIYKIFTDKQL